MPVNLLVVTLIGLRQTEETKRGIVMRDGWCFGNLFNPSCTYVQVPLDMSTGQGS